MTALYTLLFQDFCFITCFLKKNYISLVILP